MIRIRWHYHTDNTGFGNKLILSCFAECYSIDTGQQVFNWLETDILRSGGSMSLKSSKLVKDNQTVKWRQLMGIDIDAQEDVVIVGRGTTLSNHAFHQTTNDIERIKKHKERVVKDFGRREGTFVHVRVGKVKSRMVPGIEYYKRCLPASCSGYVSSDRPRHSIVRYLLDHFDLKLYKGNSEETIIFGSSFDNKVLSLGTFSWWIGFIGNQTNVIYPNPDNYTKWHGPIFQCMDNWRKM